MAVTDELRIEIKTKADQAKGELSKVEGGLGGIERAALAAFSTVAVIAFGRKVLEISKELTRAASDAQETANKFNVVFRGVEAASGAADDLAESYGLAHQKSEDLLSGTADLLQGFGVAKDESLDLSVQVQRLAVDLASFTNYAGGADGASQALTSALLGEREAVKSLGIAITDAELKRFAEESGQVYSEMTKGEQAVLTLELAYRQSANAIGDFARSQDSYANQARIAEAATADLKAELGEGLLPIATKAKTIWADVATRLAENVARSNELYDIFKSLSSGLNVTDVAEAQERITTELDNTFDALVRTLDVRGRYTAENEELLKSIYAQARAESSLQDIIAAGQRQEAIGTSGLNARQGQLTILLGQYAQLIKARQDLTVQENRGATQAELIQQAQSRASVDAAQRAADAAAAAVAAAEAAAQAERDRLDALAAADAFIRGNTMQSEADLAALREKNALALRMAHAEYLNNLYAEGDTEQEIADRIAQIQAARLSATAGFFGALSDLIGLAGAKSAGFARLSKGLSAAQAGINSYLAFTEVLKDPSFIGNPLGRGLAAAGILASGLAQQYKILSTPIPAMASGGIVMPSPGGSIVNVAEAGRPEAIIPLDRLGGMGNITVNVYGSIGSQEEVAQWVHEGIARARQMGKVA